MKVVVIGGGPGGIQATRTIKMHNPDVEITMIRPEPYSVIYCALPYVIENLVEKEKIRKSDELVTSVGAKLVKDKATKVDFNKKVVFTEKSGEFTYDKLIIATGANPFVPPIPGSDLCNIATVKTESDLENILSYLEKGAKKAVVVGAGNIGIEMAVAMKERGLETYLVEMQNRVLPNLLDEDFAKYPEEDIRETGINLLLNTRVDALEGEKYVEKVVLSNGNFIELGEHDLVVFAVGVKPNIEIFKDTELKIDQYGIVVNEHMMTNIDGVYAVGDVASFLSFIDGKPIAGKLATNAVPMGKIAAYNILGRNYKYQGFINGAITKAVKWRMGGTGFTEEVAKQRGFDIVTAIGETTTRFPIIPGAKKVYVKLIADKKTMRIIGGQVVAGEGVPGRIDTISLAIQNRNTCYDLFNFSYCAQPFQTFFPANNAIVMAAEKLINIFESK
ncbi:FAD-dependent pyridine nucleotide-disulphide oxidoreductase [Deferribacter desulfuricans SSM1]|uniref:FAD-dependent pyridine nucleotide-disulphide oxidoreductase n=1 Tax=Deferribacter desulfuricans (strain DSM 14783 / JCM 11476 / NBRC 101012 / SSM1) TaxID=639282 RepID=D3PC62_DEFDS|nr:FAD-dependent oxidoreductase [Deferribacter desulfuricans]BAI80185.1 FAD-dependent pyridine nucleotide-disulphide oxidoreductase [Deferribacter desulfuricans SSM1]